jgi:tRNA pseudouridine38-40 synthase
MDRNVSLVVAFDGTSFHGFQTQPGLRTVQEELEKSIGRAVRHPATLTGSGRTDAGVHAAGHVSNFRTTCTLEPRRLAHSIGSRLPRDISIVALRDVKPEFRATICATSKLYRYRIFNARHRPVERFTQRYVYHYWEPLDLAAMKSGARYFVGKMDYSSMAASGTKRASMVREVLRCDVERHRDEIRIDVEGTGFLWKQVRTMVGTLVDVGRGRWSADHVGEILATCDRTKAGPTVPARGLCLQWVRYPSELFCDERPITPAITEGDPR